MWHLCDELDVDLMKRFNKSALLGGGGGTGFSTDLVRLHSAINGFTSCVFYRNTHIEGLRIDICYLKKLEVRKKG